MRSLIAAVCLVCLSASWIFAKEIVIATAEEIEGTDIQQIEWENVVHRLLVESPIRYNADMSATVPGYASSWSLSDDSSLLSFTIGKGMKFSNGDPVTADAVKASFDRYLKISPYAADLSALENLTVEGDTVTMHWKASPIPALLSLETAYGGLTNAAAAAKVSAEAFNRKAVTYGPMMVDEWVQGSHITLVPNPNFKTFDPGVQNKGPMKVDKVTVRFIADDFTRVSEIQAGSVDIVFNVPLENIDELKADDNIQLFSYLQPGCTMFYMNPEAPMLQDIRVRRALQRGIDKSILITVLNGNAQVRDAIFSRSMLGYSKAAEDMLAKKYGYDFKAACDLLDQAGWKDTNKDGYRDKDGKTLELTAMIGIDYPISKKTAPVVQALYKKLGVKVNLREYEGKYIKQAVRDKKYDLGARRYVWADGDMLTYLFHTESENYSYPDIDAIIEKGRAETDPKKRAEIYGQAQDLVLDKGLAIPLVSSVNYVAVRKNIKSFVLAVEGTPIMNDVVKE